MAQKEVALVAGAGVSASLSHIPRQAQQEIWRDKLWHWWSCQLAQLLKWPAPKPRELHPAEEAKEQAGDWAKFVRAAAKEKHKRMFPHAAYLNEGLIHMMFENVLPGKLPEGAALYLPVGPPAMENNTELSEAEWQGYVVDLPIDLKRKGASALIISFWTLYVTTLRELTGRRSLYAKPGEDDQFFQQSDAAVSKAAQAVGWNPGKKPKNYYLPDVMDALSGLSFKNRINGETSFNPYKTLQPEAYALLPRLPVAQVGTPNAAALALPLKRLQPHFPIITTNYDMNIEKALHPLGEAQHRSVTVEAVMEDFPAYQRDFAGGILHLHGTIYSTGAEFILATPEYINGVVTGDGPRACMALALRQYSALFIGAWGTMTDLTLLPVWRQLAQQEREQPGSTRLHFAAVRAADATEADAKLQSMIDSLGDERTVAELKTLSNDKDPSRAAFGWTDGDVMAVQHFMRQRLRALPFGPQYEDLPPMLLQLAEEAGL